MSIFLLSPSCCRFLKKQLAILYVVGGVTVFGRVTRRIAGGLVVLGYSTVCGGSVLAGLFLARYP